jgi:hypothetical protein
MPLVGIGTLPTPFSPASVSLPPETGGRGHTSLRLRVGGWGGVPIPTRGIHCGTLSMYVLCDLYRHRCTLYQISKFLGKNISFLYCIFIHSNILSIQCVHSYTQQKTQLMSNVTLACLIGWKQPRTSFEHPEPVFLNVYGAQESIPRKEFRQPM